MQRSITYDAARVSMLVHFPLQRRSALPVQPRREVGGKRAIRQASGKAAFNGWQQLVYQRFGQRPGVVYQHKLTAQFGFICANESGDEYLKIFALYLRQRRQPLLAVDDKPRCAVRQIYGHLAGAGWALLDRDAADECDDDRIRKYGLLRLEIVANLPNVGGYLRPLESAQISITVAPRPFDGGELQEICGASREAQNLMLLALARADC